MTAAPDFAALAHLAAERARRTHEALLGARAPRVSEYEIRTDAIEVGAARVREEERAREPSLYGFDFEDNAATAIAQRAFQALTETDHGRKLPRLNKVQSGIAALYVGKCSGKHKSVGLRLWDHFGFGHEGTYALNLSHWRFEAPIRLKLWIARYPHLPDGVVDHLEAEMWEQKRPMLGQKGGR